jgi:hypothetical protein
MTSISGICLLTLLAALMPAASPPMMMKFMFSPSVVSDEV